MPRAVAEGASSVESTLCMRSPASHSASAVPKAAGEQAHGAAQEGDARSRARLVVQVAREQALGEVLERVGRVVRARRWSSWCRGSWGCGSFSRQISPGPGGSRVVAVREGLAGLLLAPASRPPIGEDTSRAGFAVEPRFFFSYEPSARSRAAFLRPRTASPSISGHSGSIARRLTPDRNALRLQSMSAPAAISRHVTLGGVRASPPISGHLTLDGYVLCPRSRSTSRSMLSPPPTISPHFTFDRYVLHPRSLGTAPSTGTCSASISRHATLDRYVLHPRSLGTPPSMGTCSALGLQARHARSVRALPRSLGALPSIVDCFALDPEAPHP